MLEYSPLALSIKAVHRLRSFGGSMNTGSAGVADHAAVPVIQGAAASGLHAEAAGLISPDDSACANAQYVDCIAYVYR